ncbi:MAG: RdgB/HAM1 family non-canonical purine NTP pyrophosphatase [Acidobacteriota bacterium]|nr:RdgB/HAM1 family non-canonical purine NTP pyrophosphatase [Acidobacteriota bacterium]
MKRVRPMIVVATGNAGKAREIAAALKGVPLRIAGLADLGGPADYEETGLSFAANARGKAAFYSARTGLLTLAEDSGLMVEALGGAPGVVSARFAGPGADDARNNRKLLRLLAGVPPGRRTARFVCCMVLARDGRRIKQVTGRVRGRILERGRGGFGFGYDPLFFYPGFGRTFGELSPDEKNSVSHRGRAIRAMAAFITAHLREF